MSAVVRVSLASLAGMLLACADDTRTLEPLQDASEPVVAYVDAAGAEQPDAAPPWSAPTMDAALADAPRAVVLGDASTQDAGADAAPVSVANPARALFGVHHWNGTRAPDLVDAVGAWIGRPVELAMAYASSSSWREMQALEYTLPSWSTWVAARKGRKLLFSLPMLPGENDGSGDDGKLGTSDDVSLAACAAGAYDEHWRDIAAQLVDAGLGDATLVRLGWESDGEWFTWSSLGKEAAYAGCFRSAVKAMRGARPTAKLEFDFSVSDDIAFWEEAPIRALYPGNDVVDVISVNAYDVSWEPDTYPIPLGCVDACAATHRLNGWNDMMRGVTLVRDFAISQGKRYAIAEWGVWQRDDGHGGGDNVDYIVRMHDYIRDPANHVYYQSYFDVDYLDGAHQLSDVSGDGVMVPAGHAFKTLFPLASAKYKELFGQP